MLLLVGGCGDWLRLTETARGLSLVKVHEQSRERLRAAIAWALQLADAHDQSLIGHTWPTLFTSLKCYGARPCLAAGVQSAADEPSAAMTVFRGFQPSMYLVLGLGLTPVARARKHVLLGFSES